LNTNPNDYKALNLKAKALIKLERNKEALSTVKKALCIKPNKAFLNYLKILEGRILNPENSCSTIEENENSAKSTTLQEAKPQILENKKNDEIEKYKSRFTITKILRIFAHKFFSILRKNKLLFTILLFMLSYYFKQELTSMLDNVLGIVKFK
jgi:hypothetical protein